MAESSLLETNREYFPLGKILKAIAMLTHYRIANTNCFLSGYKARPDPAIHWHNDRHH
jgi:hypothetical protein